MNFAQSAGEYVDRVVSGEVPACEHVVNACRRFIADLDRQDNDPDWPYLLDLELAETWCSFLETLPHVKGRWASKAELFVLSDWQIFCTVNIFGWVHRETGIRRFREAYIEVPRKNGKSYWVAGLCVAMLSRENEIGSEIYTGATSEKQAWEVFRPGREVCIKKAGLRRRYGIEVNARSISRMETGSRFQPIIGNPGDGSSPLMAVADEFHEHSDSDQVDTMVTGMGAREQPLMFYITTAGTDMGGPCYIKRADVISILKGSVSDDLVFGIVYTLDDGDAWDTTEALVKANPNYDVSVSGEFLEGQLKQARRSPSKQAAYKTKHLNMWVGAKAAWMNMLAYQACRKKDLKLEDFRGRQALAAIDLASKTDIASMAILVLPDGTDPKYSAFVRHYLPEETILENSRYQGFHAGGWLVSTPGNVTDFEYIEEDLKELKSTLEILEVPYDPFQATQFATRMLAEGFPMVEVGATVKNFSEPMKELEAMILRRDIQFDMDPVLLWMFGNVTARVDLKDNVFCNKERPENKIDGVVALIMAINRMMAHRPETGIDEFLQNPVII